MKKMQWEYKQKQVEDRNGSDTLLRQLGEEGWELVAVVVDLGRNVDTRWFYFKRPKEN